MRLGLSNSLADIYVKMYIWFIVNQQDINIAQCFGEAFNSTLKDTSDCSSI